LTAVLNGTKKLHHGHLLVEKAQDILQGNVTTHLRCSAIVNGDCYKFTNESDSERVLKIKSPFAKVMASFLTQ